ncbi:MAG: cytidine deaminase [Acidobacteria bacterium]|nr:cytidine deaminase [Acidobacteriota bacterium]
MERRNRERRSGLDRRAGWDRRSHETLPVDTGARTVEELLAAASKARLFAQAAFSDFKVGAALETREGIIVTGCNVENATYGLTMCAERVALFKALSEGHRAFSRVVVVTDAVAPVPPCGSCRQLLWEYGGDLEIMLATPSEVKARFRLKELLPLPFDARFLSR